MGYRAVFDGFKTKEQAQRFIDWFEGQGEQDETLPIWLGEDEVKYISVDVHTPYQDTETDIIAKIIVTKPGE